MDDQKLDAKAIGKRVKAIILNPEKEWPRIKGDPISNKNIILTYVLPLAAIAALISLLVIWLGSFFGFGLALKYAVLQLVLPIVTIIISAIIINELAETFNSIKDLNSAFKLVAYSYTPWLLTNIIASISWSLSWFTLLGLYGIYLLWIGFPVMMKTSEDKHPVYALAAVVIILIINLLLTAIFGIDRLN